MPCPEDWPCGTGKKVVVLESKLVGSGNSGRHTGEMTTWKKAQYASMHSYYDKPTVAKIAESHKAAIQHVEKVSPNSLVTVALLGTKPVFLRVFWHAFLASLQGEPTVCLKYLECLECSSFLCKSAKRTNCMPKYLKHLPSAQ